MWRALTILTSQDGFYVAHGNRPAWHACPATEKGGPEARLIPLKLEPAYFPFLFALEFPLLVFVTESFGATLS